MLAAQKVQELLEKYNLSLDEIELKNTECIEKSYYLGKKVMHPVRFLGVPISLLTDTKVFFKKFENKIEMVFFGKPLDVEAALYTTDIIKNSMENEFKKYKKSSAYKFDPTHGKTKRVSFMNGVVAGLTLEIYRIDNRRHMKRDSYQSKEKSLIVLKDALVESEFKERHEGMKKKKFESSKSKNISAFHQGVVRSENINITQGIE